MQEYLLLIVNQINFSKTREIDGYLACLCDQGILEGDSYFEINTIEGLKCSKNTKLREEIKSLMDSTNNGKPDGYHISPVNRRPETEESLRKFSKRYGFCSYIIEA